MKIRIVGGPIESSKKVEVDLSPNSPFSSQLDKIEVAVGASIQSFKLQHANIVEKKVKPGAMIDLTSTPEESGMKNGSIIILKSKGSAENTPRQPSAGGTAATAASPSDGKSYKERVVAIFEKYEPAKVKTADALLKKYEGKEDQVIKSLTSKYGPEPEPEQTTGPVVPPLALKNPYAERITAILKAYDPSKVNQTDAYLKKYPGKEEALIASLVKKYGPEPPANPRSEPGTGASLTGTTTATSLDTPNSPGGARTYRDRVRAIFEKYDPGKVSQTDATLAKYAGKEEAVIKSLVKKYGPEPEPPKEAAPAAAAPNREASPASGASKPAQRSYKERVVAIFEKYEPAKVKTADALLKKYEGKEDQVIKSLTSKYGPEPEPEQTIAASASGGGGAEPVAAAPRTYRDRVRAIFEKYDPGKVSQTDATLAKYAGKEEAVIKSLVKKYGPEPEPPKEAAPAADPASETAADPVPTEPSDQGLGSARASTPPMSEIVDSTAASASVSRSPSVRSESHPPSSIGGTNNNLASPPQVQPQTMMGSSCAKTLIALYAAQSLAEKTDKSRRESAYCTWYECTMTQKYQRMAKELIEAGEWVEVRQQQQQQDGEDSENVEKGAITGYRLEGSDPPLIVADLAQELRMRADTKHRIPVELQDALRTLSGGLLGTIFPRGQEMDCTNATNIITKSLEAWLQMTSELDTLQKQTEKWKEEQQDRINETSSKLTRTLHSLDQTHTSLVSVQTECKKLQEAVQDRENKIKEMEKIVELHSDERERMKKKLQQVCRELADERRGIPSDIELRLAEKDERLARSHQQLAQARTALRTARNREESLTRALTETGRKLEQWKQLDRPPASSSAIGYSPAPFSPNFSTPLTKLSQSAHPVGVTRAHVFSASGYSVVSPSPATAAGNPSQGSNQHLVTAASHQEEEELYGPEDEGEDEGEEVIMDSGNSENDDDLEDFEETPTPSKDCGPCPNCSIPLAPFRGDAVGAGHTEKIAFCFSCRKAFSKAEIGRAQGLKLVTPKRSR